MSKPKHVDLHQMFLSLQVNLLSELRANQAALKHPGAYGQATEIDWLTMFSNHLPHRYQAAKATVIDSRGGSSDEIDIVIYDRQYTPVLFQRSRQSCITAESVYAVFEVKSAFNKRTLDYTADKVASVRRLHRTSGAIHHAGGTFPPREPFTILGGILCTASLWKPAFGKPFEKAVLQGEADGRIDLGCVLESGAFEVHQDGRGHPEVETSSSSTGLIFFLIRLLHRLQSLATAPAIDFREYERSLR